MRSFCWTSFPISRTRGGADWSRPAAAGLTAPTRPICILWLSAVVDASKLSSVTDAAVIEGRMDVVPAEAKRRADVPRERTRLTFKAELQLGQG
jgi:hypothetical protein